MALAKKIPRFNLEAGYHFLADFLSQSISTFYTFMLSTIKHTVISKIKYYRGILVGIRKVDVKKETVLTQSTRD